MSKKTEEQKVKTSTIVDYATCSGNQLIQELCDVMDELNIPVSKAVEFTDMPNGVEIKVLNLTFTKDGKEASLGIVIPRTICKEQKKGIVDGFKQSMQGPLQPTPQRQPAPVIHLPNRG